MQACQSGKSLARQANAEGQQDGSRLNQYPNGQRMGQRKVRYIVNNLSMRLEGKVVKVRVNTHTGTTPDPLTRLFKCVSGGGCYPTSQNPDTSIRGFFLRNFAIPRSQEMTIDSNEIEGFATEREVEMASQ
jgi:hypothetical protein